MGRITGATDTQKTVITALAEGWLLRHVDGHGWCLFQPGRERPFARVKQRTVDAMTIAGWLSVEQAPKGLGSFPTKQLTSLGDRYADKLLGRRWADEYDWDPYDHTVSAPKRGDDDDTAVKIRLAA